MNTKQIIYSMLTENTGGNFLDSGSAYKYHYKQNARHTLEEFEGSLKTIMNPEVFGNGQCYFGVRKSLFHHLVDALEYDEYLDKLFHRFVDVYQQAFYEYWDYKENKGYGNFRWDTAMNSFRKLICKSRNGNRRYSYWRCDDSHYEGYTYNEENILSQDFTYYQMGDYVFIETHNGCDARGGFSWPHLFRLLDEGLLFDINRYTIGCKNRHLWEFIDGHEDTDQPYSLVSRQDNFACPVVEYIDGDNADSLPASLLGKVVIREGKATCPVCGEYLGVFS